MNRAYALLDVKSVREDGEFCIFSGIASTPTTDRMGDIVEPMGAKFATPMPLLWQHDSHKPVGHVTFAKATKTGIPFEARIPLIKELGTLKDRLDEAVQSLKYGLVAAVSIGFAPVEGMVERLKNGGLRFLEWNWLELSMVTIPANPDAKITGIKSIDDRLRAASGHTKSSPANGPRQGNSIQTKGKTMKLFNQETLAALQSDRQTKAARLSELLETKGDEGFTEDARAEFTTLKSEVANLDDEIAVCEVHVGNISKAKPVEGRGTPHIRKFKDAEPKFKGEEGLKRAVSHIVSMKELKDGNIITPAQVFERSFGRTNPTMASVMKAAVAGGGSDSGEWGAELVQADTTYTGDFLEYLYGATVFDRLPLREVPHNVVIKGQDGSFTGYFTGQSKAIKMSKGDFSTTSTIPYKAAGITVVSNEWLRDSSPSGLSLVGEGLRNAVALVVDSLFLSATAISNGVSPAGILNGTSATASNGGDAQSIATDMKALFAPFITAKNTAGGFYWIMTPTTALALSLMRNALGQPEYPTLTPNGGTWMGYPVVTGDNLGTTDIILIKPSDVWKIGDLGATLSVSTDAMIEQDDSPTGATDTPVAATAYMTSMFQEDSTAIKIVRPISWGKRRAGPAQYITDAAYGAETS